MYSSNSLRFGGQRGIDVLPRIADAGLELGILGDALLQRSLLGGLARQHVVVVQRVEHLAAHLDGVLDASSAGRR